MFLPTPVPKRKETPTTTSSETTKGSSCENTSPPVDPVLDNGDALSPSFIGVVVDGRRNSSMGTEEDRGPPVDDLLDNGPVDPVDATRTEACAESEPIERILLVPPEECLSSPANFPDVPDSEGTGNLDSGNLGMEAGENLPCGMCESGMIALNREVERLNEAMNELRCEFDASVAFREQLREERDELHKELAAQVALNVNYREELGQCHHHMAEMEQNLGDFHVQSGFQRTRAKLLEEQLEMADERLRDASRSEKANNDTALRTNMQMKTLLIRLESIEKKAKREAVQTQAYVDSLQETLRARDEEINTLRARISTSTPAVADQEKNHAPTIITSTNAASSCPLRTQSPRLIQSSSTQTGSGTYSSTGHSSTGTPGDNYLPTMQDNSPPIFPLPTYDEDGRETEPIAERNITSATATTTSASSGCGRESKGDGDGGDLRDHSLTPLRELMSCRAVFTDELDSDGREQVKMTRGGGGGEERHHSPPPGTGRQQGGDIKDKTRKHRRYTNGKEQDELLVVEAWSKLREREQERKKGMKGSDATTTDSRDPDIAVEASGGAAGERESRHRVSRKNMDGSNFKKHSIISRMEEGQAWSKAASSVSSTSGHVSSATRSVPSTSQTSSWMDGFGIPRAISRLERRFGNMVREFRE